MQPCCDLGAYTGCQHVCIIAILVYVISTVVGLASIIFSWGLVFTILFCHWFDRTHSVACIWSVTFGFCYLLYAPIHGHCLVLSFFLLWLAQCGFTHSKIQQMPFHCQANSTRSLEWWIRACIMHSQICRRRLIEFQGKWLGELWGMQAWRKGWLEWWCCSDRQ